MSRKLLTPEFLHLVNKEIEALRSLPLSQRMNVQIEKLNTTNYANCIYGLLFHNPGNAKIFKESHNIAEPFSFVCNYETELPEHIQISFNVKTTAEFYDNYPIEKYYEDVKYPTVRYSALEMYITIPGVDIEGLVALIRSESLFYNAE